MTYKFWYSVDGKAEGVLQVKDVASGEVVFLERTDLARSENRLRVAEAIARKTGLTVREVEAELASQAAEEEERRAAQRAARQRPEQPPASAPKWEPGSEARKEAEKLLERQDLLAEVVNTINDLGVTGERPLVALAYLVATSRLLEKPLYLLVQGEPSSGKSFILQTVCKTLPPTSVETVTDLTPEALYYLTEAAPLKNRVLFLGERRRQKSEESIDATRSLRELHEAGRLSKLVPIKEGGRLRTVRLEIEGAPAILESVSHNAIPAEDLSRAILAWTNETEEQTRQVLREFARRKASGSPEVSPERLETIRAVQWLLEPWRVSVPFLPALAEKFPAQQTEARRAFVRLAALTEASALLHQRQRKTKGDCLLAEVDDLRLAWQLLAPWLRVRLVEGPPPSVLRLWEAIRTRTDTLTQAALIKMGLGAKSTIGRALTYLERAGAIGFLEGDKKTKPFRVVNPAWRPEDLDLLGGMPPQG